MEGERVSADSNTIFFGQVDEAVLQVLNATPASGSTELAVSGQKDQLVEALAKLEQSSAEINEDWAEENRLVDLFPLRRNHSNRARFLAKFGDEGCGSGVGEDPIDKTHPSKKDLSDRVSWNHFRLARYSSGISIATCGLFRTSLLGSKGVIPLLRSRVNQVDWAVAVP
jgi:hypothetical protein